MIKNSNFFERRFWLEKCTEIENLQTNDPKQFWNKLKDMGPRKKKSIPFEVYDNDNTVCTDTTFVLDKWKQHFESLYKGQSNEIEYNRFKEQVKEEILLRENTMSDPLYVSNPELNCNVTIEEVRNVVMKAKLGKAAGVDCLPYEVLKSDIVIQVLVHLFQICLDSGKIPSIWRKSVIFPIPKSSENDPRVPSNYRGISLICCTAKLYSSLLNGRITTYFDEMKTFI